MLISSFVLAWRRSIFRILCAVRLGIGKRSGFISITMLLPLPERTPGPLKQHHEWCVPAGNADQVGELLEWIAKRRREGMIGATVVSSWLRR